MVLEQLPWGGGYVHYEAVFRSDQLITGSALKFTEGSWTLYSWARAYEIEEECEEEWVPDCDWKRG